MQGGMRYMGSSKKIDEIKKEVMIRNQRHNLVIKANDLIRKTSFSLTDIQQKIVNYVISLIKPGDSYFQTYTIKVKDFAEICGINIANAYNVFKDNIMDLASKNEWIQVSDNGDGFLFQWFSDVYYTKGAFTLRLNDRLKIYLLNQTDYFTKYELWNGIILSGKSCRMYELFISNQYKNKNTIQEYECDYIKKYLGIENNESYKLYSEFKRRIWNRIEREINTYTDINVQLTPISTGSAHKVTKLKFHVSKKTEIDIFSSYNATIQEAGKRFKKNGRIIGQLAFDENGILTEEK